MKFVILTALALVMSSGLVLAESGVGHQGGTVQKPTEPSQCENREPLTSAPRLPKGVKAKKVSVNFDGSWSVDEPQLLVGGSYLRLAASHFWGWEEKRWTAEGFCRVLRKDLVSVNFEEALGDDGDTVIELHDSGQIRKTLNADLSFAVQEVICQ